MRTTDTATKPVKLWRLDEHGRAQLTELHRDQFPGSDEYRAAIDFHLGRGCRERLADCYAAKTSAPE